MQRMQEPNRTLLTSDGIKNSLSNKNGVSAFGEMTPSITTESHFL